MMLITSPDGLVTNGSIFPDSFGNLISRPALRNGAS
jgi:hypothetical protein